MDHSELRLAYQKEYSRLRRDREDLFSQLYAYRGTENAFVRIQRRIRDSSLRENLESDLYLDRLEKLCDFFRDLVWALDPKGNLKSEETNLVRPSLWYHRNPGLIHELIKNDKGAADSIQLDSCIATYLNHEWLKDDWIDWVLLDASIWSEFAGNYEHISSTYLGGWPKLAYLFSGSNPIRAQYIRTGFSLAGILFRYIIPISALLYFWKQKGFDFYDFDLFSLSGAFLEKATRIYLLYLVIRLATWPFRFRNKKNVKKEEAPILEAIETIGQIYEALAFPPISLENLRSYVYKARDESVIIRNSTYSLLDDLAARGTIVLAWED